MKIAIIGAAGMAGRAVYREAAERGHDVVGIVRNADRAKEVLGSDANLLVKDAFELQQSDLSSFDVVVNAFATASDKAYLHVDLTAKLVAMFRETSSPRLFFILGAGSLLDQNERPFVETIKTLPGSEAWVSIPVNQFKQLEFLRQVDNVNWVGVSPSASFVVGEKHTPVIGQDHLLTAADGKSHTTNGTMAVAVLNEIEKPTVLRARFTVSD
ncbi:NAD(P)H-binding protein [Gorillibacterium timonense]|uniref:NAD(P)H-binding protein n=1 Tax=Gorillibacterium timonense TaxID=1689269 RepID=UPI00071DA8BF|nr:NAD(P)H-binding protein [Gorillibacterium timonense]